MDVEDDTAILYDPTSMRPAWPWSRDPFLNKINRLGAAATTEASVGLVCTTGGYLKFSLIFFRTIMLVYVW